MSIVAHNFNGKSINQLLVDTEIGGKLVPKGCVNGTEMCKANGKKLNDYLRLKSTSAYIEALSRSTGIPVDLLVFNNESSGKNEERGTWLHIDIAIHLAIWASPEFAVWATSVLRHVIEGNVAALTEEAEEAIVKLKEVWMGIRSEGKVTRRSATDAIKEYCDRNPVSVNYLKWIYSLFSDTINKGVFGKTAKELREERNVDTNEALRDSHDADSLKKIERIEDFAMRLIDKTNTEPNEAAKEAIRFYE